MAFTRFYDDPCRIQKYLEETTNIGNYSLNVPGNGMKPVLINDPHINIQKWGANLSQNKTDLESELHCLHRKLNKDSISENNYVDYLNTNPLYSPNSYSINNEEITAQSRATHPAWIYREINHFASEQAIPNNFNYLHLDPQENICIPFHNNISSRIVQKDYYQLNNNFDIQRRITN
jgi:hypothetical protein